MKHQTVLMVLHLLCMNCNLEKECCFLKKLLVFTMITLAILSTTSCVQTQQLNDSSTIYKREGEHSILSESDEYEKEGEHSILPEGDEHNVQLIYIETPERNHTLSSKQAEYLNSIWNSEWQPDITKTLCIFQFETNDVIIRYSHESGVFIDDVNQRHIIVSDEQRNYINSSIIEITVQ